MATIGTFKKTGTEYTGEIFTLSLQAKGVRLVPDLRASGENAPSHRVLVGRAEIGAAWTKKSNEGREYLGLKLDDPSFAAPIYANRLCCTNPVWDSSRESSVIAGGHEQTEHTDLQDPELARIQQGIQAPRIAIDLVRF